MSQTTNWSITIKAPFNGFCPKYYRNSDATYGDAKSFNYLKDVDLSDLNCVKQGPNFTDFTVINSDNSNTYEKIVKTIDYPVKTTPNKITYGISATYLWKIDETTHTITMIHKLPTGATGINLVIFNGNLFYWYNTGSNSNIGQWTMANESSGYTDAWGTSQGWVILSDFSNSLNHPMIVCGALLILGNGQYVATYDPIASDLAMKAVKNPSGYDVADITTTTSNTYVLYNCSTGAEIQIFDVNFMPQIWSNGKVTWSIRADNTIILWGIGSGLFTKNGLVYVISKELSDDAFSVWYINGNVVSALKYVPWEMPNGNMLTWYKGFLSFIANNNTTTSEIFQLGQQDETLPLLLNSLTSKSKLSTLSNPFGTLLVATDTAFKYANKLSLTSKVVTLTFEPSAIKRKGIIDEISVRTNALWTDAGCKITLTARTDSFDPTDIDNPPTKTMILSIPWNNNDTASYPTYTNDLKNFHIFPNINVSKLVDFKLTIEWDSEYSSDTNPCEIREILINGRTE